MTKDQIQKQIEKLIAQKSNTLTIHLKGLDDVVIPKALGGLTVTINTFHEKSTINFLKINLES